MVEGFFQKLPGGSAFPEGKVDHSEGMVDEGLTGNAERILIYPSSAIALRCHLLLAADGRPLCFASLNISPNRGVSSEEVFT